MLLKEKAKVKVYDPVAMDNCKKIYPEIEYSKSSYEAAGDADALLIVTEWNEFRNIDLKRLKKVLVEPVILDLRNIFEPERVSELGFKYFGVGRS